jgi:hypothetical protein
MGMGMYKYYTGKSMSWISIPICLGQIHLLRVYLPQGFRPDQLNLINFTCKSTTSRVQDSSWINCQAWGIHIGCIIAAHGSVSPTTDPAIGRRKIPSPLLPKSFSCQPTGTSSRTVKRLMYLTIRVRYAILLRCVAALTNRFRPLDWAVNGAYTSNPVQQSLLSLVFNYE